MASRTKKKAAPRKAAAPKARAKGFGLPSVGWLAAVGVVAAWAISDGRPARYARSTMDSLHAKLPALDPRDEVAGLIKENVFSRPVPKSESSHRVASSSASVSADRTGSIAPAPRPAPLQYAAIPKPSPAATMFAPQPKADIGQPFAVPAAPVAKSRPEPTPSRIVPVPPLAMGTSGMRVASLPSGGQRHATRELVVHAAPNGDSAKLGAVDSGSSVLVMRSAGGWRYVRSEGSNTEGWVDGRFLAGEATSDAGTLLR